MSGQLHVTVHLGQYWFLHYTCCFFILEVLSFEQSIVQSLYSWLFRQILLVYLLSSDDLFKSQSLLQYCMRAKSLQVCLTLCHPMDCIPHQAPLSMVFSRPEHWSRLSCHPSWYLLNPGIEPVSLMSPTLVRGFFTTRATWEALYYCKLCQLIWLNKINLVSEKVINFILKKPKIILSFLFCVTFSNDLYSYFYPTLCKIVFQQSFIMLLLSEVLFLFFT